MTDSSSFSTSTSSPRRPQPSMNTPAFVSQPAFGRRPGSLLQRTCSIPAFNQQPRRSRVHASFSPLGNGVSPSSSPSSSSASQLSGGKGEDEDDQMEMSGVEEYNLDYDEDDDDDGLTIVDVDEEERRPQRVKKQRKKVTALVDAITTEEDPETKFTSDSENIPPLAHDATLGIVRTIVQAADSRKAEDIVAIRVAKVTYVASFIIIATGNSSPQLRAISNLIEQDLTEKHGMEPRRIDGVPTTGWLLLDYGDILINIFNPEQRENYNLEKLWRRGEELQISQWLAGPSEETKELTESALDDWTVDE